MKVKSRNFIVYDYYVMKSIKVTINNTRQERVEVYSRIENDIRYNSKDSSTTRVRSLFCSYCKGKINALFKK